MSSRSTEIFQFRRTSPAERCTLYCRSSTTHIHNNLRKKLFPKNKHAFLLLCILILPLIGCNKYKFSYNNLSEWLIYRQIDDTFDLTSKQRLSVKQALAQIHDWHRREQLPKYVDLIQTIDRYVVNSGDSYDVEKIIQKTRRLWMEILIHIQPNICNLFTSINSEQIDHAEKHINKRTLERFKKLQLPTDQYAKERLKIAKKWMKMFLGSFTDSQLTLIATFIRNNNFGETHRLEQAKKNQQDFFSLLRAKPSESKVLADVTIRWLSEQMVYENSEFQETEARRQADFVDLLVQIEKSLLPEQRNYFRHELRKLEEVILELSANR